MGDDPDEPWRARLADGERDAIALLYDRFAPLLFRTACGLLGSAADAEDAVHEVFVSVASSRTRLAAIADLRAYLFTALHRAAVRRRRPSRDERLIGDPIDPRESVQRDDALEQAIGRLPTEQREVIALKIDGRLTFDEVAAVLGINANTAASRYRYALAKLRTDLEGEW